jgi:hypothetical protein
MARLVVTAVVGEGRSKSEVARDYGVSRRWVQILVQRFVADGEAGLEPRSRRPHRSPQRISEALEPGMNPQGVQVVSFKQPSSEELDHTFLWRISKALPERGSDRHLQPLALRRGCGAAGPARVARQAEATPGNRGAEFWAGRYDDINAFERHLDRNGTKIVKFFLHVSKAEQKRRFMARLDQPAKLWKFSAADVAVRAHWDEYMRPYDDAITATSTDWASLVHSPGRSQARDGGDGSRHRRRYHRVTRLAMADRFRRGPRRQRKGPSRARGRVRMTGRSTAKHRGTTSKPLEV